MFKIISIFILIISLNISPVYSNDDKLNISVGTTFISNEILGSYNGIKSQNKTNTNFNLAYKKKNLSSQLTLNFNDHNKLSFDNSFANYQIGAANINIGKINRVWSFSDKSSLILSSNARPLNALSIEIKNKFNTQWLPPNAKWEIEIINASTKNSYNGKNSMLTGARAIISPSKRLSFEFLQTSQWGGEDNNLSKSKLGAILLSNTNNGEYANINKMAGFGLSYTIPINKSTYRAYGQAIGEDEAGNLPSCYSWIAGIESLTSIVKVPTKLTFELIDTRVDTSTNRNCRENAMYNNNTYEYINYNTVMGVPIDTEGNSLELFGQSIINKNLDINYSIKFLSINDKDYAQHRLSSKRKLGKITSFGIKWKKEGFNFGGNISYQNMRLNKVHISNGIILSLFTSIKF